MLNTSAFEHFLSHQDLDHAHDVVQLGSNNSLILGEVPRDQCKGKFEDCPDGIE